MCANGGKCNSQTGECTCAPGMQSDSAFLYTNQLFVRVIYMISEGEDVFAHGSAQKRAKCYPHKFKLDLIIVRLRIE